MTNEKGRPREAANPDVSLLDDDGPNATASGFDVMAFFRQLGDLRLSRLAKSVGFALLRCVDRTGFGYASAKRLAWLGGVSERSVGTGMTELRNAGVVEYVYDESGSTFTLARAEAQR